MTIGADALPMPSNYALRQATGVFESRGDLRRMHLTNQPDPDYSPRIWLLTWQNVRPEVVKALWSHYEQHGIGTFLWMPPAEDAPDDGRHFRWLTPPSVNWTTPAAASVTGELEEVLAYTP